MYNSRFVDFNLVTPLEDVRDIDVYYKNSTYSNEIIKSSIKAKLRNVRLLKFLLPASQKNSAVAQKHLRWVYS